MSEVGGGGNYLLLKKLAVVIKTQFNAFRPLSESGFGKYRTVYCNPCLSEIQHGLKSYLPPRRDFYILETTRFFISKCVLTRGWDDYRFGQQRTVVHEQLTSLVGVHLFHCSPQSLKNALTLRTFKTRLLLLKSI